MVIDHLLTGVILEDGNEFGSAICTKTRLEGFFWLSFPSLVTKSQEKEPRKVFWWVGFALICLYAKEWNDD